MILSSPVLITFAQTKALAFPPIPSTIPFPWLVTKYFHKKDVLCFWLCDWKNFTIILLLNSDYGPSDHIICTALGSLQWLKRKSMNTATTSLPLSWLSSTITKYVLHSDVHIGQCCGKKHDTPQSSSSSSTGHSVRRLGIVRI